MKLFKKTMLLSCFALSLIGATAVFAQQHANSSNASEPVRIGERNRAKMQAAMEKYHHRLHDKLKLSAQQEVAWKAFTDVMATRQEMQAERPPIQNLSAPVQMEKMLEHAQQRVLHLQKHLDALKTFYAVLTPEQQKVFDEHHHRMQRGMRMHMRDRMQDRMHNRQREHGMEMTPSK
ncbi:Spy/CpxP family protein refolding chaperone [Undibacterium fentianense]|uniref:Spy/CpxP family protein refolding chaperone n=1 Tax=Undibacterium fentianense TaxID=2828728 RepID=A0A941E3P8_9BURK|nr:Spy/CpxP family protein refolding chaperone [Undibacterium fentianense]MBR7801775.1 Spy/CpxP family protein refolding chaperone [Undibacterium fentianense]